MELRHLRYFVAVAEELHFGRAAERVRIAQPPLSQQIRRLEGELGVQLFDRTKRRVELTHAGRAFLREARQTLAGAEQAVRAAQQASRGEVGELAVGFVGSATYHIVPLALKTFRQRFPKVELVLEELSPTEQVERLRLGEIQVGFFRSVSDDEALKFEWILEERLVMALPETHPLARQKGVHLAKLSQDSFVLFPRAIGPGFYDLIVSQCRRAGFSPRVALEASNMQTIVSLVAAGLGVALVPASCQNFRRVGVMYKAIREPGPKAKMAVAWRRGDRSPVLHAFLDVVREVARRPVRADAAEARRFGTPPRCAHSKRNSRTRSVKQFE
jgi:DNA-binding transcriptional LysR family regulator